MRSLITWNPQRMAIGSQIEFTRIYQDLGSHEPQWQELDKTLPYADLPGTIHLYAERQNVLLYADVMLKLVFFNLPDNSIRYRERLTKIRVSVQKESGCLVILCEFFE